MSEVGNSNNNLVHAFSVIKVDMTSQMCTRRSQFSV